MLGRSVSVPEGPHYPSSPPPLPPPLPAATLAPTTTVTAASSLNEQQASEPEEKWKDRPYHEEVHFPPKMVALFVYNIPIHINNIVFKNLIPMIKETSGDNVHNSRLNKSSSMHDLAHAQMVRNGNNM